MTYSRLHLNVIHRQRFEALASRYDIGHLVGVSPWELQISPEGTWLITEFRTLEANGLWSELKKDKVKL